MSALKENVMTALRPFLGVVIAALGVASSLPACAGGEGEGGSIGESVRESSQELVVGGHPCSNSAKCSLASYASKSPTGDYYLTTFGGGSDTGPLGCGDGAADGTWAYVADSARWGCGARLKIEANGKQCVAKVADCGPNRCVEDAAGGPIIDASPYIAKHLYGISSAGWSDHIKIKVTEVDKSTPLGCGNAEPDACQHDSDCPSGHVCDKGTVPYQCVKRLNLGDPCSKDSECDGGVGGTSRVCSVHSHTCIDACHSDFDCQSTEYCDKTNAPGVQWHCASKPSDTGGTGQSESCVLTYPSGVSIKGVPTPASVANDYDSRGCGSMKPKCMINVNDIVDAKTGKKLSYNHVKLSAHFTLRELTLTSAAVNPYVYIDPNDVVALEATRGGYGHPMIVNSGFRSPAKQNSICHAICGKSYCPDTCALCSDHMGGQATDLQHSSPKCAQAKPACTDGHMHLIYNEKSGGDHLHIDIGKKNPVCTYKALHCP